MMKHMKDAIVSLLNCAKDRDLRSAKLSLIIAGLALFAVAALVSPAIPAGAQTNTPTPIPAAVPDADGEQLPPLEGKINPPKYRNMDSILNRAVEQYEQSSRSATAAHSAASRAPVSSGADIAVTFHTDAESTQSVADFLRASGGDVRNVGEGYIEAYVPVGLLPFAAQQPDVLRVRSIIPPQPAQSVVGGEGAAVHGAPAWNAAGFSGQGVKVGIIDSGFAGYSPLIGTELPAPAGVRCYTDIGTYATNLSDCLADDPHGTAVAEAVIDVAPQATLYIADPTSQGDLHNTVNWMISQGVDVINMSLIWGWDGPGDGTSPYGSSPLKAVDNAVSGGIIWVNGAGNTADATWFGSFVDRNGDGWHEYVRNDACSRIIDDVGSGTELSVQLRWDDIWGGATQDLDLYLYRVSIEGALTLLESGSSIQDGSVSSVPYEFITYTIPDDSPVNSRYCFAVIQDSGTEPSWIQISERTGFEMERHTLFGSINNPSESANPGMLAVGAANWITPSVIEDFSSRGPTPDGRVKPDIVGADGATSAAYGEAFEGTSQASPHVAGLAALVVQAFPGYSPQQVADYLKASAVQRDNPDPNNIWGHGFAVLPAQPGAVVPIPTPTAVPTPRPEPPPDLVAQVNALQQAMAALTDLVNSLVDRIAALEGGSPPPPQPTATPVPAPTATPTPRPGEPTPTPAPTATPEPTATPGPSPMLSVWAIIIDVSVKLYLEELGEPATDAEIVSACEHLEGSIWDFFNLPLSTPDRDYTIAAAIFLNTSGQQDIHRYCGEKQG